MIAKLLVEIEKELHTRIKTQAAKEGRTVKEIVIDALKEYLKNQEK